MNDKKTTQDTDATTELLVPNGADKPRSKLIVVKTNLRAGRVRSAVWDVNN